jgi:tRNA A37 threonylcarbamoyladenosine dehydratase
MSTKHHPCPDADRKPPAPAGPPAPAETPARVIPNRCQLFHRTELLLGKPAMSGLTTARVAIFGVGGVGSWAAEALIRSGIEHLLIVDSDVICATNVNRQSQATALNVGQSKPEELRRRLLEIHPRATIDARQMPYNETTRPSFDLGAFDYVLDCIDSLSNKVLLLEHCQTAGVTVFSSMGAGAKLDPTRVRVAPISESSVCPLARMVRKRLGRRGLPRDFLCVYSEELPREPSGATSCGSGTCDCQPPADKSAPNQPDWCKRKRQINGTVVHVTAVFGFTLAGLVVQDVLARTAGPTD